MPAVQLAQAEFAGVGHGSPGLPGRRGILLPHRVHGTFVDACDFVQRMLRSLFDLAILLLSQFVALHSSISDSPDRWAYATTDHCAE